jgi:hypothetical protein
MEPASHVQRGVHPVDVSPGASLYATGREVGVTYQTVERCLTRAQKFGVEASLKDSPGTGREPAITNEGKMFVLDLARRKAKGFGLSARSADGTQTAGIGGRLIVAGSSSFGRASSRAIIYTCGRREPWTPLAGETYEAERDV